MPGFKVATKAKAVQGVSTVNQGGAKTSSGTNPSAGVVHREWNGKGGFKPGNQYGKRAGAKGQPISSDRAKLATDLKASRKSVKDKEDRDTFNRHARLLKEHRAGKKGSISDEHAKVIYERFHRLGEKHKPESLKSPRRLEIAKPEAKSAPKVEHKPEPKTVSKPEAKKEEPKSNPKHDEPTHEDITVAQYAKRHGVSESAASEHLRKHLQAGNIHGGSVGGTYRIPLKGTTKVEPKKIETKNVVGTKSAFKPSKVKGEHEPANPVPKAKKEGDAPDSHEHDNHEPGHVGKLNTDLIHFDPKRFQYKHTTDTKTGSVESLAGVQKYDENLGGIVQVWKDPGNGKTYVVNGHNRVGLAKKLGAEQVTVRYIDAKNAKEARSIGALTNIAEGRGTAVDAAKYFRDTGLDKKALQDRGVPMREKIAEDGLALAKLDDSVFSRVSTGQFPVEKAAIIGGANLTHAQQRATVALIDSSKKNEITNGHLKEIVDEVKSSGSVKETIHDLFGSSVEDKSLALHKTKLQSTIKARLASETKLFGLVSKSKNAEKLTRGENVINAEKSGDISKEAAQTLDVFDRLKSLKGPVSKHLNEAAERIHNGENAKTVTDQTYKRIVHEIPKWLESGDAFG